MSEEVVIMKYLYNKSKRKKLCGKEGRATRNKYLLTPFNSNQGNKGKGQIIINFYFI